MSVQAIHRSVYDFHTTSKLEKALALDQCFAEDTPLVASWKLQNYEEASTVDSVNDSYAESKRLKLLASYDVLSNPHPDPEMDELVYAAMELLDAPMAAIGFMDLGKLVIKSSEGFGNVKEVPRSKTICAHTIQRKAECGVLVVPDIQKESRFNGTSMAANGVRFYAGAPIRSSEGAVLGVLCVCDSQPRPEGLSQREKSSLQQLADVAMANILMA